jgi:hypothetical protein
MNTGQIQQFRHTRQFDPNAPSPVSNQAINGRRQQRMDRIPPIQRIAPKFPECSWPKDNPERQIHLAEMAVDSLIAVRQAKQTDKKSLPTRPRYSRKAKQLLESSLSLAHSKTDYHLFPVLCQRFASTIDTAIQ